MTEITEMNSTNIAFELSTAESLKIVWKISDFLSLLKSHNYSLDSPSFMFANATWCLRIDPNKYFGSDLSLVRLHSSLSCHEIISACDTILEDDNEEYDDMIYDNNSYDKNGAQPVGSSCTGVEFSEENKYIVDGNLTLMVHIFSETSGKRDAFSQKVSHEMNSSEIYEEKDTQNSSSISLRSSKARSLKITWRIPDYFNLPIIFGYSLDTPPFIFANEICCLKLHPNGMKKDYLRTKVSLVRLQSLLPCHKTIFVFKIKVENRSDYFYDIQRLNENNELNFFLPERSELLEQRSDIAPDDCVTLLGHFLCEESSEKDAMVKKVQSELDNCKTLCRDLKNLLLNGQDVDLTLKVKDKEFRVHRSILRARSQVFESMLTHDMIEKNSGVVDIPDCEPQAMEQFLLYIYSGKVETLNENNMLGLYYIADKYNMMPLKDECSDFIQNSLSCSNFCDVIQLALNHSDKNLLEFTTEFFTNNTNEILTTAKWMLFLKNNAITANELFLKASKKWTDAKAKP